MNFKLDWTPVNILTLVSLCVLGFWSLQQVYAQTFVTYRHPHLGFIIDYPTDWGVGYASAAGEYRIIFGPLDRNMSVFHVLVGKVPSYLDTDTMTVKNKTVEQVAHEEMINMSKPNPYLDSKVIRQNQFTIDGNAGWKMEMFVGPEANPFYYVSQFLTIANGKIYHLEYNEKPLKVPETLPLVNKMVESFHIIR